MIDYQFVYYESIDSTNSEAKRLCHQGSPEGTVVIAKTQTTGRGRLGRRWISPTGNLYFTMLLKPQVPIEVLSQLSLVAGIALARVVQHYIAGRAIISLKWPNDVLINQQKVAGILVETDIDSYLVQETPCYLGIGVNIQSAPELTVYPATSLKDIAGLMPQSQEFLQYYVNNFNALYIIWQQEGFAALKDEWLSFATGLGDVVQATSSRYGQVSGQFKTITDDGGLLLIDQEGNNHIISSSEVTFPYKV